MAALTTVKSVLARACLMLQDASPPFVRWSERELVHWLDDAQRAVAKFLPLASSRIDAIKLRPGTRQSIESIAPADCKPGDGVPLTAPLLGTQVLYPVCNMGADGLTPGPVVRMVDRDGLDASAPMWHATTGSVLQSVVFDPVTPRYFFVRPGVTGDVWLLLAFTAAPVPIPNTAAPGAEAYLPDGPSTLTIGVADEHVDDLVNYVLARAYMKNTQGTNDPSKAAAFSAMFVSSLNAKVIAVTGNNPNLKALPFAPTPLAQAA